MIIRHRQDKSCSFSIYPVWKNGTGFQTSHLPQKIETKVKKDMVYLEKKLKSKKYSDGEQEVVVVYLGGLESINETLIRKFLAKCLALIKVNLTESCDLFLFPGQWNMVETRAFFVACEALLLTHYSYDRLKNKKKPAFEPDSVQLIINNRIDDADALLERAKKIRDAVFLARDLINGPANLVDISYMEKTAAELGKDESISLKVYKEKELKKMNMDLLLAVGRSSAQETSLLEMQYRCCSESGESEKKNVPKVCLVAKGIVFDSGGLDLKPVLSMDIMKSDMGGAAVVLGVLKAAAALKVKADITALIPLAENSIGGNSYRPGDVITGHKGIAVEIKNTDAEGRLILADALSYSDSFKPDVTIDIATLTGGAISALGTKISAAFFNDQGTGSDFLESSRTTGEPVWELPLFEEYLDMLKADTGDTSNLGSPVRQAATIIAALFLSKFVDNKKWIHLDIAGPVLLDKSWDIFPKGGTGIMVRTILDYLENLNK